MIPPNLTYLAFDDRKMMYVGIPLIALVLPLLFFGVSIPYYLSIAHQEYTESLIYTIIYWLFNRYLIIALRKKYGVFEQMWKRFRVQFLIILIATPILSVLTSIVIVDPFRLLFGLTDQFEPTFLQGTAATYFLTALITVLYEAIYYFKKYKEAIVEKEQIQRAHIQSQLDNLRNQINPHFLFNSLNTLMNLIPTDSDRAMNYLNKLSKFYRYTVSNQDEPLVSLQRELDNLHIYADLLQERFQQGIHINIPESVSHHLQIPPLCLQLLVENAVKHNVVSKKNPLTIDIQLIQSGTYLEVKNNIQKKIQSVSSTGMGLKNIKKRVAYFTKEPLIITEEKNYFSVAVPLIQTDQT